MLNIKTMAQDIYILSFIIKIVLVNPICPYKVKCYKLGEQNDRIDLFLSIKVNFCKPYMI